MERVGETKHEYVDGEIISMAGASPRHNLICSNLIAALAQRLKDKPCVVLTSDQRVHGATSKRALYSYPDVTVLCGPPKFHPKDANTLANPTAVFEVLSPGTEDYDRGGKITHYQAISSLQEFVLVSTSEKRVDHYHRLDAAKWVLTTYEEEAASLVLPGLGCAVGFDEIYAKAELFPDQL